MRIPGLTPAVAEAGSTPPKRKKEFPLPPLRALTVPLLLVLVLGLLLSFFVVLGKLAPEQAGEELRLDQLRSLAAAKQVQSASFLDEDATIAVQAVYDPAVLSGAPAAEPVEGQQPAPLVAGEFFVTYPKSDAATGDLLAELQKSGAQVSFDRQDGKARLRFLAQFLLPLLILASLFALLFISLRGGGASEFSLFSQIAAKRKAKNEGTGVTFADVGAAGEAIAELAEIRDYLNDPTKYQAMGALAPKGVLLVGPPGTGKTLLAKAVAGESKVPFFFISGSEFVESLVGVGAARVRSLFRQVRAAAPAIVFIDELDAAGRQRGAGVGQGNDEREQTLNQLLVEMDGFDGSAGVVVMGATNRPDILDPALLRPGRFDRQVTIDVPDVVGRLEILTLYAKGRPMGPDISLERLAKACPGFSGAELAGLMNEAALLTVRAGKSVIGQEECEEAIDRVVAGPARRSHILSDEEKRLLAYHESGHAVAARALGLASGVHKISIVARGRNLGHTATFSDADKLVRNRQELFNEIVATMAGTAAEVIVLGQGSTGDEADLRSATDLAREMVCSYGMSEQVGRIAVGSKSGEVFLGRDLSNLSNLSEHLLTQVDIETARLVGDAEKTAERLLVDHREVLDTLAGRLITEETLAGEELDRVLNAISSPVPVKPRRRRTATVAR
jgi:cell division protease FtsH